MAALLHSWREALPWWPFSILFANILCLGIMIRRTRAEGSPFHSILLRPFPTEPISNRILPSLGIRIPETRFGRTAIEIGLFLLVFLTLGLPAMAFQEGLKAAVPVLNATPISGPLPPIAVAVLTPLLPLSQGFVEFPWFYGFIFPKMESSLVYSYKAARRTAWVRAWIPVLSVFLLQISLLPPVFDPAYMIWQALSLFPLLALIGITLRCSPHWMPWINLLHGGMALNLILQYWRLAL
jgi:hypothetical protein